MKSAPKPDELKPNTTAVTEPPVSLLNKIGRLRLLSAAAALHQVSPDQAELFASTRLAGNSSSMYGAVDLARDDMMRLLDRTLPS